MAGFANKYEESTLSFAHEYEETKVPFPTDPTTFARDGVVQ